MQAIVKRLLKEDSGQGLVEYALILALIAIVVIGALTLLGGNVEKKMNQISQNLA